MGEFILLLEYDRNERQVYISFQDTSREYEEWGEIPRDTLKALQDATSILSVYFTQLLEENDDE
jgi:hypothetical protein